jgi:hypothetical protein
VIIKILHPYRKAPTAPIATIGQYGLDSQQGLMVSLLSIVSRPVLGPTLPLILCTKVCFPLSKVAMYFKLFHLLNITGRQTLMLSPKLIPIMAIHYSLLTVIALFVEPPTINMQSGSSIPQINMNYISLET